MENMGQSQGERDRRDAAAEQEYDSGYRDGFAGLSFVHGEPTAYQQGWHSGVTARAERDATEAALLDAAERKAGLR